MAHLADLISGVTPISTPGRNTTEVRPLSNLRGLSMPVFCFFDNHIPSLKESSSLPTSTPGTSESESPWCPSETHEEESSSCHPSLSLPTLPPGSSAPMYPFGSPSSSVCDVPFLCGCARFHGCTRAKDLTRLRQGDDWRRCLGRPATALTLARCVDAALATLPTRTPPPTLVSSGTFRTALASERLGLAIGPSDGMLGKDNNRVVGGCLPLT